jgi:EAL domain-containing protein (putative c-di-GMP-specific phosphodiesterase class I)
VLREACRQARLWFDSGIDLHVCVNVSADEFCQANFATAVEQLITETGIPPAMLELELTERIMVDGFSDVIETIAKLKLAGIRLAIDDFGTGYSSLSYLKYFPSTR